MKILIDIGHPSHVHYFKNFIRTMQKRGHKFLVTARDKEVTFDLLRKYGIRFVNRGAGGKRLVSKLLYLMKADIILYRQSLRFKPDFFLSFGSPYAAHASMASGKTHIAFDDTEHAKYEHMLYYPFTDHIFTPSCYLKKVGNKQIKFNGFMELAYLQPKVFKPNPLILEELGVKKYEKYVILRFVSWQASHDIGQNGLSLEMKKRAVKEFSKYAKIFISAENDVPTELKQYKIKITPEKMHDVLYYATMYFGEGGTMSTECAILGTPNILINPLAKKVGVHRELRDKYGLKYYFDNFDDAVKKATILLSNSGTNLSWIKKRDKMLSEKIDVNAFMVWIFEKYPDSIKQIKNDTASPYTKSCYSV